MKHLHPKRVLFANSWWHIDIVTNTVRHAAAHGWHLDLQTCLSGKLPEMWSGDGIITMLSPDVDELLQLQQSACCPMVSLNANEPELDIPRVTHDDGMAADMAAGHFLERGFRSFAYYSHAVSLYTGEQRRKAFEEALGSAGHSVSHLLWEDAIGPQGDSWENRQGWLRKRLPELPQPLAVFATNDQAAVEVIEACRSKSIAVPDQVAVLGMLDMPIFRESTSVPLSSITVDFDRITGAACDLLARMMDGEAPPAEPIIFPPTGIAVRRSTDTIAAKTPEVARAIQFMLAHYSEPIGLQGILQEVGLSKTVLYERFNADVGQPPHAVLIRIRIDKAKRMLRDTNAKIYAVSEACGFGDPINLYRQFKNHVGTSPASYRRQ